MATVYLLSHDLDADPRDNVALEALLDPRERARAAKFAFPRLRRRYKVGRAVLRCVLGRWTGKPPASLALQAGPEGKPLLDLGTAFNLSHSEGRLLLAVSSGGRLGVDLELWRPVGDLAEMTRANFAPDECAAVLATPPAGRDRAFLEVWTRKEALIKALGGGLSIPLQAFSVSLADRQGSLLERLDLEGETASDWCLRPVGDVPGVPGAIAAVALDAPEFDIEWLPAELAFG